MPPGTMVSLLAIVPYSVYCGRVLTMASATALIASATARVAWICALANSAGPASLLRFRNLSSLSRIRSIRCRADGYVFFSSGNWLVGLL